MSDRSELRDAFFAEVRRDPYAHMLAEMTARAWAEGYECALRDNNIFTEVPFDERRNQALAWMTKARDRANADMIVAMAQLGPLASAHMEKKLR